MLRPTRPEDAAPACALVQAGVGTYARFAPGWVAPDLASAEAVALAAARFAEPAAFGLVEDVDGTLEGVVFWRPPEPDRASRDGWLPDVHLQWLFVAEHRWGDGLAQRLHAVAVAAMQERGVRNARLFTPAGHARARAFYERAGWRTRLDAYLDEAMGLQLVEHELTIAPAAA